MSALFMTVVGVVGTEPRLGSWNGTPVLSFRMVASERRYDSTTKSWIDVHSSWVSVCCFRGVARNVAESVRKGDRLIVHGKVKVKEYVTNDGQRRTVVDIEGTSIGHDLKFGTSRFQPAVTPENADERLLAAAAGADPDLDDELLDEDGSDDLDDEDAHRRTVTSTLAGVAQR